MISSRDFCFARSRIQPAISSSVAPLAMNDPGEPEKRGSLIVVRHGKGSFVYTGLSFFRQLPAGVPGAFRLFANLISQEP